jgi:hypothetical protein
MTKGVQKSWQELGDEFHMMVGYCIAEWANVEDLLFKICAQCLSCSMERAAIIYFRTPNIDARLTLASELVKTVLPRQQPGTRPHPDVKLWDTLAADFRELLQTRNRLAHHPVMARTNFSVLGSGGAGAGLSLLESWFEIYVSNQERLRGRSKKLKPLIIADLKKHAERTQEIKGQLRSFTEGTLAKHNATYSLKEREPPHPQDPKKGLPAKPWRRRKSSPRDLNSVVLIRLCCRVRNALLIYI